MEKLKKIIIPHLIGFVLILIGWYICILNVGLDKFSDQALINNWTLFGLGLILTGAYIPNIAGMFGKKQ